MRLQIETTVNNKRIVIYNSLFGGTSCEKDICLATTCFVSAWFFGDPHIHTLDNLTYTFNGLGEYTLIEISDGNFTLQGRTVKALDKDGAQMNATVFSAFAAKDSDSDRVHIEMNSTRNGAL